MTAVEWLEAQLSKYCILTISVKADLESAKAIEKEQLHNAYEEGYNRVAKLIEEATKLHLKKD
jgi:hypothetical protein